ncbi:hypothetical protein EDB19DRAFT_1909053 [Suillus lakei]|nr:hypothetical protein EDB19DRAFT_1909053 [Suillus lakei]
MLFNETACFSKQVPKEAIQTWSTHGGRIYSGGTSAVASYFFAVSREDEWTSILCRRSVVVIHVGWILHCVAHEFRVPVVEYILDGTITSHAAFLALQALYLLCDTTNFSAYFISPSHTSHHPGISCTLPTDGFDAWPPLSRMGVPEDHMLASVVSPRYPQQVSRPLVPRSQPRPPLCIPPNASRKRKRQRDSLAYPNALHSESGDSLPRRPRKRRMLSLQLFTSSAESSSDIAITEAHDFTVTQCNHDAGSTLVVTPDICFTNTHPDNHTPSTPYCLTPPFKAMPKHKSQGSSFHCSPRNDRGHEKAVDPNCAYECDPGYTLTANDTGLIVCLKDSSPVPAIDFTRLQFPSRNRWRFPLLRLEPVTAAAKVGSREDGENSARPAVSDHTPIQFAQYVTSATQPPGKSAVPGTRSSGNYEDTETALPITRQGTQVGSSSSPGRLGEAINSRNNTVAYHIDQLIRTRKRATGCDDVQFATLWERNAMWKGERFWHENLRKPTWSADNVA